MNVKDLTPSLRVNAGKDASPTGRGGAWIGSNLDKRPVCAPSEPLWGRFHPSRQPLFACSSLQTYERNATYRTLSDHAGSDGPRGWPGRLEPKVDRPRGGVGLLQ